MFFLAFIVIKRPLIVFRIGLVLVETKNEKITFNGLWSFGLIIPFCTIDLNVLRAYTNQIIFIPFVFILIKVTTILVPFCPFAFHRVFSF